jgi:hypothetical protein
MNSPYDTGRFAEVVGLHQVTTHSDLAAIVEQLVADLRAYPTEWENPTLERFLAALARSLNALPALYSNRGEQFPPHPTWKLLAESLIMATGYE